MLRLFFLLLSFLVVHATDEVLCTPLDSGGYWSGFQSSPPETQGEWVTPGCKLRPWSRANFRNRRIAIIGDSVSRFLMFDLAAHMFRCPPLVDCNPKICNSGIPDKISKDVGSLREPCASLYQYTYVTRLHENLYLRDPSLNASLDLYWISYAEEFLRHGWVRPLFVNPAYDAFIMSLGLWDVGVKPKPGLDVIPSVAHHCAWIVSHVKDLFLNTLFLANPSLKRNILFWTTSYSEPYRNPNSPTTEYERFPHDNLDTVNRCSRMAFKEALGTPFFNTTSILKAPPPVLARLLSAEWGDNRTKSATTVSASGEDASKCLTLDGYHPHRATREALINEMMNHYVSLWGPPAPWDGKDVEPPEDNPAEEGDGGNKKTGVGRGGNPPGNGEGIGEGSSSGASSRAKTRADLEEGLSYLSILGMAVVVFVGGIVVMRYGDEEDGSKLRSSSWGSSSVGGKKDPSPVSPRGKAKGRAPPAWARL